MKQYFKYLQKTKLKCYKFMCVKSCEHEVSKMNFVKSYEHNKTRTQNSKVMPSGKLWMWCLCNMNIKKFECHNNVHNDAQKKYGI